MSFGERDFGHIHCQRRLSVTLCPSTVTTGRQVAEYDDSKRAALLADSGIIRHSGKIDATINNANAVIKLIGELGSFDSFVW